MVYQQIYLRTFSKVFSLNLVDRLRAHLSAELPKLVDHARQVALAVVAAGELERPAVKVATTS